MYRLDRMDALRTVEDTTLLTTELGRALERASFSRQAHALLFLSICGGPTQARSQRLYFSKA